MEVNQNKRPGEDGERLYKRQRLEGSGGEEDILSGIDQSNSTYKTLSTIVHLILHDRMAEASANMVKKMVKREVSKRIKPAMGLLNNIAEEQKLLLPQIKPNPNKSITDFNLKLDALNNGIQTMKKSNEILVTEMDELENKIKGLKNMLKNSLENNLENNPKDNNLKNIAIPSLNLFESFEAKALSKKRVPRELISLILDDNVVFYESILNDNIVFYGARRRDFTRTVSDPPVTKLKSREKDHTPEKRTKKKIQKNTPKDTEKNSQKNTTKESEKNSQKTTPEETETDQVVDSDYIFNDGPINFDISILDKAFSPENRDDNINFDEIADSVSQIDINFILTDKETIEGKKLLSQRHKILLSAPSSRVRDLYIQWHSGNPSINTLINQINLQYEHSTQAAFWNVKRNIIDFIHKFTKIWYNRLNDDLKEKVSFYCPDIGYVFCIMVEQYQKKNKFTITELARALRRARIANFSGHFSMKFGGDISVESRKIFDRVCNITEEKS